MSILVSQACTFIFKDSYATRGLGTEASMYANTGPSVQRNSF